MIAYFDTSAMVPLIIDEPGTEDARAAWDNANRRASVALVYVEARAALAQARRLGRVTAAELRAAVQGLERIHDRLDVMDVDDRLIRDAGAVAESNGLRAYDAVHLAAALQLTDPEVVFVAGDIHLLTAAQSAGLATAPVGTA